MNNLFITFNLKYSNVTYKRNNMLGNNHLKNLWQRLEWPDKADIQHLQHKQAKVLKLKHDPNIFTFLPYKIQSIKTC